MTEPVTPRPGKDFILGFIPSLVVAILVVIATLSAEMFTPLVVGGIGLLSAAIMAVIFRRPFIGVGIITVIISAPLLLIGSCFALLSFNQ